jgi:hypothetical protein
LKKDTEENDHDLKRVRDVSMYKNGHCRCAQWNHSGCSFTEMFAFILFIKRNKSDAKFFA